MGSEAAREFGPYEEKMVHHGAEGKLMRKGLLRRCGEGDGGAEELRDEHGAWNQSCWTKSGM